MSSAAPVTTMSRAAVKPFYFNTSAHLLRITRYKAGILPEFLEALRECPEDSIFQHTFRTLQEHHFIREGFSNDFAHWALSACNEPSLAEGLASVDVREFTSVAELRGRFVQIVEAVEEHSITSPPRRLAAQHPDGPLFRNTDGRPWTLAYSGNTLYGHYTTNWPGAGNSAKIRVQPANRSQRRSTQRACWGPGRASTTGHWG